VTARHVDVDVSIITSGHDVADARLHRLTAALQRAGVRVEILGLGEPSDAPSGATTVRTWPRRGPARRATLAASLPWRAAAPVLVTLDPDVLISSSLVRRLRRKRVVADVHEDYSALVADRPWKGARRGVASFIATRADAAARRSDLTVVVDDHVPPFDAVHRLVVRNLPDADMLPVGRGRDADPRAVYVGDIRRSRGLHSMLDAIAAAPARRGRGSRPVAAADQPALEQRLAADPDLARRVRLHGRLTPTESWQIAAGAWVGFCLLAPTPAFVAATASKLYEYLAAGIVPVVSDLPRQRELVERSGSGYIVDDAGAPDVLNELAANPTSLDQQVVLAQAWIKQVSDNAATGYDDFARAVMGLVRG